MSERLKFIWIDDTKERKASADNLQTSLGVDVEFVELENKEVNNELDRLLSESEIPDLILMDHSFTQAQTRSIKTGSSASAIIRENWQSCPIISVTATAQSDMDITHQLAYEAVFRFEEISSHYQAILSIAQGFKKLRDNQPTSVEDVLSQLDAPENDHGKLKKVLPQELKSNFEDVIQFRELFKWCKNTLFKQPGFLYDKKWVCTLLGLSETGFEQVEAKFETAVYNGVFSSFTEKRWWKAKVLSVLGSETDTLGQPWVIGRGLVNEQEDNYSKCYSSQESFPETVAATDATPDADWYPMKLKHTVIHPDYESLLFFEEIRMMKPAE